MRLCLILLAASNTDTTGSWARAQGKDQIPNFCIIIFNSATCLTPA